MSASLWEIVREMEAILRRAYGDEYVDAVLRGDYDGDYGDDD